MVFSRCRGCENVGDDKRFACRGCSGFYGVSMKLNDEDGYIVKVKDKRLTVYGTLWYQLNHCSIKRDVKRFHPVTWFGVCSYRKLKVTPELRKDICPICQHDLEELRYSGSKSFVVDRLSSEYKQDTFEDAFEDGVLVWVAVPSKFSGSGHYED